jgi:hypothetical protein
MNTNTTRTALRGQLTAALSIGLLAAGSAQAAKAPKVDICHFDAEAGTYTKISTSPKALPAHLGNHGDVLPGVDNGDGELSLDEDCLAIIIDPPEVVARAFINADRQPGYNPTYDIPIVELIDTFDDDMPSAGDTLQYNQYPTSFDPCDAVVPYTCYDIGQFQNRSHTATQITYHAALNGMQVWYSFQGVTYRILLTQGSLSPYESIIEYQHIEQGEGLKTIVINDTLNNTEVLRIEDQGVQSPTDPDVTPITLSRANSEGTDQYHLDVEF